ncbi:unnamed protein product [Closterium sp. Yama58-4]|nr:unnamed protein product [Closterium sp. Yama58-4]
MAPPFLSETKKLDTLYSVGEERTVVLAIDTCKSCLSAFDSLAASCHKTQSFLSANSASSADFQLKPTDRLVVVFHHANHTPISIMTRGAGKLREGFDDKSSDSQSENSPASPSTPRSILSALLSPLGAGGSKLRPNSASGADDGGDDSVAPPRLNLPRHQLWRPQLNPSNVVRQMQEAGRADAAPVVVMALMAEREVRRALAERTAWDRRTKRAVMRMAAVARACKIRFEVIDLSDIAGEPDSSKKRDTNPVLSMHSPPSACPRKTCEKSPPSQALSWEAKADAVIRFCLHINAELLLLPSSHACKALNFSGKFATHNFTIRCTRDAPCPLIKLGADSGGDGKDGRRSCKSLGSVSEKDYELPRSATLEDLV